jgi:hypothetical protein
MNLIVGICLKNVLIEKGEDHDKISAEILMNNNKIGDLVNDGWCEEYYIEFVDEVYKEEFEKRLRRYYKRKNITSDNYDVFIKDLLFVCKEYKAIKDTKLNCEQLSFIWK